MKTFALFASTLFILSVSPAFSQGFFYETAVSPNEGGKVTRSIVSIADTEIVENYVATPSDGYVFTSWTLYPRGEHNERIYVHSYDPTLFYTEEIKTITANFVRSDTIAGPNDSTSSCCFDVRVGLLTGNQIEIAFDSVVGSTYSIQGSKDLKTWNQIESGIVGEGNKVERTLQRRHGKEFFRLIFDSKGSESGPEKVALEGELTVGAGEAAFDGASAWVRVWEYDPLLADKAADLFAEAKIHGIAHARGKETAVEIKLGDGSKVNPARRYYVTAAIYRNGKVGDIDSRIYFLDGFNRVELPTVFNGLLKKL